jgi:acyl-CoA reductase-like NAD-dependent aldehyde dehydrogenase
MRRSAASRVAELFEVARAGQHAWATVPLCDRVATLLRFNEVRNTGAACVSFLTHPQELQKNEATFAKTISAEMGKPMTQARAEVRGTRARVAQMARDAEEAFAAREVRLPGGSVTERVEWEPLGVVANISAWNYPLFVASNVFAAALLGGNSVLYKPSELTPRTGALLAKALHQAGLPPSAFTPVPAARPFGKALAQQPELGCASTLPAKGVLPRAPLTRARRPPLHSMVCFTGSTAVGRQVAAAAGAAGTRFQLELGGKDAVYVRHDVPDVEKAAVAIADGAFFNAGQSCCSVERIYVHESVATEFTQHFISTVASFRVGAANDDQTYIGPLARGAKAAEALAAQVADAVARGAQVAYQTPPDVMPPPGDKLAPGGQSRQSLSGAGRPGQGIYYPPTVLLNVDHSMVCMREETFGPLACIQVVKSDGEAAALMDDCQYGLTAGVYSADQATSTQLLRSLAVGTGYWNACDRVSPRMPWGGRRCVGLCGLSCLRVRGHSCVHLQG